MRSIPTPIHYPVTHHGNARQSGSNFNRCFSCGETGHYIKSCLRPRVQTNVEAQHQTDSNPALQVKGTSGFSGMNLDAYLRVMIGNHVYDCLLDTGSEVCHP